MVKAYSAVKGWCESDDDDEIEVILVSLFYCIR